MSEKTWPASGDATLAQEIPGTFEPGFGTPPPPAYVVEITREFLAAADPAALQAELVRRAGPPGTLVRFEIVDAIR